MINISDKYKNIIEKTVRGHRVTGNYEVNVFLATVSEIKNLHHKYMASQGYKDEYHDVLSFPLGKEVGPDGITRLGDIVVCDQEKDVESLAEHGCLHLLGVHHE